MSNESAKNTEMSKKNRSKSMRESSQSRLITFMINDSNQFLKQFGAREIRFQRLKNKG